MRTVHCGLPEKWQFNSLCKIQVPWELDSQVSRDLDSPGFDDDGLLGQDTLAKNLGRHKSMFAIRGAIFALPIPHTLK